MVEQGLYVVSRSPSGYSAGWRRNFQTNVETTSRGGISKFSAASRRRLERYTGNCRAKYRYLGTLTVRQFKLDGAEFKGFVDVYLRWFLAQMRRNAEKQALEPEKQSILWWLEFQERGAPHLHFLYTTRVPWELAAGHWAKVVGDLTIRNTATRFEKIRSPGAMAAYVSKYAAKLTQKELPDGASNVGRFWGVRGYREVRVAALVAKSEQVALRLREALAVAVAVEVTRGTCTVKPWKYGDGITILKAKGRHGLDQSGALARMEMALMEEAARGELLLAEPLPPE